MHEIAHENRARFVGGARAELREAAALHVQHEDLVAALVAGQLGPVGQSQQRALAKQRLLAELRAEYGIEADAEVKALLPPIAATAP